MQRLKVCPSCGYQDALCWRSYRWVTDIDYTRVEEFFLCYPQFKDIQVGEIVSDEHNFYRRSGERNRGLFVFRWSKFFGRDYYKMRDFEHYKKPEKTKQLELEVNVHHKVLNVTMLGNCVLGCGVAQSGLGRMAHNHEIEGSNPSPATIRPCDVRGKVFCALADVRGSVFLLRNATLLDVAIHAHVGFSIGLTRLSSWRFSGKSLFSGFIVSLASVELFRVGYRLLFSACMDVAVFVNGMVKYGNK